MLATRLYSHARPIVRFTRSKKKADVGPFGATVDRFKSTVTSAIPESKRDDQVSLTEIPMLPYVGSMIPFYSGVPPFDPKGMLEFYPELRRRFGDFYKLGLPGMGKGIYGEAYILTDPKEMMKVLRQEKTSQLPYPRGIIEAEWPLIRHMKQHNPVLALGSKAEGSFDEDGFFGRGETWKTIRTFLQTDLLSPQSAKQYVPGMVQAAQIASEAAPASAGNLNEYANRCAFDMFNSLMFGEMTKTADLSMASKENVDFCNDSVEAMGLMIHQMSTPSHMIRGLVLGMKTAEYKEMSEAFVRVMNAAQGKYEKFREKYESDPEGLTELQKSSYLAHAIERQKESDTPEEILEETVKVMLTAAVDTTSAPLSWNLYHIAVNQEAQERLYDELSTAVAASAEGCINDHVLKRSTCPYLHAVIRETHRLTPATPISLMKENSFSDVEIHGTIVPKDSLFMLDNISLGKDPKFVDNPNDFRPERWLDDAVASRKGTSSEVIDHPFLKDPFSQGSRKCPGSRVANNEILILIGQLVLDWKITAPSDIRGYEDMKYELSSMVSPILPRLEFERRN